MNSWSMVWFLELRQHFEASEWTLLTLARTEETWQFDTKDRLKGFKKWTKWRWWTKLMKTHPSALHGEDMYQKYEYCSSSDDDDYDHSNYDCAHVMILTRALCMVKRKNIWILPFLIFDI